MKLKKWQANLILLLTAIIWGSSYILIKMALKGNMPSGVINTLRGATSSRCDLYLEKSQ
ncbi:MAG: hypothetical protein ABGA11_05915 [Liquorilactobacillus hordei]|uniref:hypothetical protein n=1 Tax=Liquorilactobacillus hordei TaxID=468911 RepID=UPI0039ED8318